MSRGVDPGVPLGAAADDLAAGCAGGQVRRWRVAESLRWRGWVFGAAAIAASLGCTDPAEDDGAAVRQQAVAADATAADDSERSRAPRRARTAEEKAAEEAEADANALARLQRVAWWNESTMVEHLALSDEQRAELDGLLTQQLALRREAERERREAERELPAALLAGEPERAGVLADRMAEASRQSARAELILRRRGFALLDADQRGRIGAVYPHLAERPWIAPLRARAVASNADDG